VDFDNSIASSFIPFPDAFCISSNCFISSSVGKCSANSVVNLFGFFEMMIYKYPQQ
jgi:hypothetical protein